MSETPRVAITRLASGVPGLDEVLGGGLPEYSFNLIAGAPGTGKTTLAHQIIFALAAPERRALYFSVIGEPPNGPTPCWSQSFSLARSERWLPTGMPSERHQR